MHYLLIYDVSDDYLERRAAFRAEHLALAWAAHERGELLLGGALADPVDGAVLLFTGRFACGGRGVRGGGSLCAEWAGEALAGAPVDDGGGRGGGVAGAAGVAALAWTAGQGAGIGAGHDGAAAGLVSGQRRRLVEPPTAWQTGATGVRGHRH